jgi:hypothetical protein
MATLDVRSRSLGSSSAGRILLSYAIERTYAHRREQPLRIDKLGVTGSSPVPPIEKSCVLRLFVDSPGYGESLIASIVLARLFAKAASG